MLEAPDDDDDDDQEDTSTVLFGEHRPRLAVSVLRLLYAFEDVPALLTATALSIRVIRHVRYDEEGPLPRPMVAADCHLLGRGESDRCFLLDARFLGKMMRRGWCTLGRGACRYFILASVSPKAYAAPRGRCVCARTPSAKARRKPETPFRAHPTSMSLPSPNLADEGMRTLGEECDGVRFPREIAQGDVRLDLVGCGTLYPLMYDEGESESLGMALFSVLGVVYRHYNNESPLIGSLPPHINFANKQLSPHHTQHPPAHSSPVTDTGYAEWVPYAR
ncbi:hypothetical protein GGG16DRAFT_106384 [Schizophyllum commune]